MHMGDFDVTDHILSLFMHYIRSSFTKIISPTSIACPFHPILFFFPFSVAYFHPPFFSAASSLSSAKLSFAFCAPVFPLAPLSFSLPGPRRHHPPLSRPVLPHPPTSAVRDTSSRVSKGDEMRRLVGFHGDQPACTGISRLNRRRLSRHAASRSRSRSAHRRGTHGGNR